MKKRFLFYMVAALCVAPVFTSCSDDDEPAIVAPIETETTFTDASGLNLTYNGQPMYGKQVIYTPDATDATKARLTISDAELDLSAIMDMNSSSNVATELTPIASVIPGEETIILELDLKIEGDVAFFDGATEQNGVNIKYAGNVNKSFLKLSLEMPMPQIVAPIETETTFTDASGLNLTYSGQPMYGKQVIYTPDATDATKARLTISGAGFDLSAIMDMINRSYLPLPPTAGVIPGEKTTILDVVLNIEGDNASFEGTTEQNGATVKYTGNVSKSSLNLSLDVTMPQNDLTATTWQLNTTSPIRLEWKSDKDIEIAPGFEWPFWAILDMGWQVIEQKYNVNESLEGVLKSVSFKADGNIIAEYKDEINPDNPWKTSALNLAMYTASAANDSTLILFLNPDQIIKSVQAAAPVVANASRATLSDVIPNLVTMIIPMLSDGVKLHYSIVDNNMCVYAGADFLLPVLKAVAPVLEDEEFVKQVVDMVQGELGEMASMVTPLLQQLPEVIDKTSDIKVGINLQK